MKSQLTVLYADEQLLVLDKPSGLLTIPDRFGKEPNHLLGLLQKQYGKVFTVHRLDRETSGILVFARNEAAHRNLSMQFEAHTIDKYYFALIDGVMHHDEGEIDKPIGEHPGVPGKMAIVHGAKPSLTFYRTRERFRNFTFMEVLLKTGRTHQIRVHFKSIGYPLAVDALYGPRAALYLSEIKGKGFRLGKFTEEETPLISRTSLHASRIRFDHPVSGERLEFETEMPKDLNAVLKQLRKWGV